MHRVMNFFFIEYKKLFGNLSIKSPAKKTLDVLPGAGFLKLIFCGGANFYKIFESQSTTYSPANLIVLLHKWTFGIIF